MSQARWSLAQLLRRQLLWAVALLWLVGALLAALALRHEMNEVLDGVLMALAEHLPREMTTTVVDPGSPAPAVPAGGNEVMHVLVRDTAGQLLRSSGPAPGTVWPLDLPPGLHSLDGWRVAVLRADGGVVVQVGESLHERREALAESMLALGLPLLAILPLAALSIHLLVRRAFAGVRHAGEGLRARPAGDLSPVPANDLPQEFAPLIAAIDHLVGRLRGLVQAERAFAAIGAHELRTPVAAARAQAQRLLAELPEGDSRDRAAALVRSLDRVNNTATKLLQLARVESGIGLAREPVDLADLASLVVDEFRHHADAMRRLHLRLPAGPVWVQGDLDALGIAIRNLVENALKHAPEADVEVCVEAPGTVVVKDDGPGVPQSALAGLLQPFSRANPHVEGTGLGLAIVSKIAEQSRARLELVSPPPGALRGLQASLSIDAAQFP